MKPPTYSTHTGMYKHMAHMYSMQREKRKDVLGIINRHYEPVDIKDIIYIHLVYVISHLCAGNETHKYDLGYFQKIHSSVL